MKRFTTLLAVCCLFITSMFAQDLVKSHTQTGTVSTVSPYGTGMVYISNDGSNDVISYTTDGVTFTNAETLLTGTVTGLNSWDDGSIAYYLGDSGTGTELHKLEDGSSSMVDQPNPIDATQKPASGVLRYTGEGGPLYFYNYANEFNVISGTVYVPNYTDGTNLNTAIANSYGPYILNSKPVGTMFDGKLYVAGSTGGHYPVPNIYTFDGEIITEVHTGSEQSFYEFTVAGNTMFFLQGNYGDFTDAILYSMDKAGTVTRMTENGMDVMIDDGVPMIVNGWNLYAIVNGKLTSINSYLDQATMSWKWKYTAYHLNAEGESDNITDMVMSGDNIYVLAATTGSETELFAINPNKGTYVNAMPDDIAASNTFTSLTAIDGGVAFVGNNGTSDVVYVSDGHSATTKQLTIENDPTLAINHLYSTGDKLFMFGENGTDTDIYAYSVAPFASQTVTITVIDAVTKDPIQYAAVAFESGLERISKNSDVLGEATLDEVPEGMHKLQITASGYASGEYNFTVDASNTAATYELKAGQEVTVRVRDFHTNEQLVDVTVTFEDSEGIKWSQTITVDSWGGITNNIFTLAQDTYEVTIERDGYVTSTETGVVVDASTSALNFVISLPTKSFYLYLYDGSRLPDDAEIPAAGGGTVKLSHNDYPTIIHDMDVMEVVMPHGTFYLASFTDVPYGTYSGVATADGFEDATFTLVVDENLNTPPHPKVYLDPVPTSIEKPSNSKMNIYPNPVKDVLNIKSEVELSKVEIYSVSGALIKAVNANEITTIVVSDLSKGVYLVATTDINGNRQITKINKH